MSDRVVGAILAGGASRRMGREKATIVMPGAGRTLIESVHDAMRCAIDDVVLVGSNDVGLDLPRILDDPPGRGPLAAIDAVLQSGRGDWYVVVPCDMPYLTERAVRVLASPTDGATVLRAAGSDRPSPLPLGIGATAADVVADLLAAGRRSVAAILERVAFAEIEVEHSVLVNVNTAADLGGD